MSERVLQALQNFKPREPHQWVFQNPAYLVQLQNQIMLFPSYALPDSTRPTCIAGLVHEFGKGELWMMTGEGFAEDVRKILPAARLLLAHLYEQLDLHRMCMRIACDNKPGQTWAKHTGFRFECGPMKSDGARGEDMDMFVYHNGERKND